MRSSRSLLAVQTFKMADIGEGIAEVTLTEWFVKEGDMIKEMDNVCSVESDKASVELSSPYTGKVVKERTQLDAKTFVWKTLLAVLADLGNDVATAEWHTTVADKIKPQCAARLQGASIQPPSDTTAAAAQLERDT